LETYNSDNIYILGKYRFNMNKDDLVKLGLSVNESLVYLVLLDIGKAKAGLISKKSQINRTTTYDSLSKLIDRGLVSYSMETNKKLFSPSSPSKLLENIKDQEFMLKEILPELESKFFSIKNKESSNIYEGKKGIKYILNDVLKHKEYYTFGSSGKFLEIMSHDFLLFQKKKKELKVKGRVILPISEKDSETVKMSFTLFKFIPNEYSSLSSTIIYGNNIAIIVWSQKPIATVITSDQVSKSYKNYFEVLWKIAKP